MDLDYLIELLIDWIHMLSYYYPERYEANILFFKDNFSSESVVILSLQWVSKYYF